MDQLPCELLARVVEHVDGGDLLSLMRTSSAACARIKECRQALHPDNAALVSRFLQKLPVYLPYRPQYEEDIDDSQPVDNPEEIIRLHGSGTWSPGPDPSLVYSSIVVSGDVRHVAVIIHGQVFLSVPHEVIRATKGGSLDLMRLLRYLPQAVGPQLLYDSPTSMEVRMRSRRLLVPVVPRRWQTWEMFMIEDLSWNSCCTSAGQDAELRLVGNHVSLGLLICVKVAGQLRNDVLDHITVRFDRHPSITVPAGVCKARENMFPCCELPWSVQDCYYLPFSRRVNLSRVEDFRLTLTATQKIPAFDMTIHNVFTNFARRFGSLCGMTFSV